MRRPSPAPATRPGRRRRVPARRLSLSTWTQSRSTSRTRVQVTQGGGSWPTSGRPRTASSRSSGSGSSGLDSTNPCMSRRYCSFMSVSPFDAGRCAGRRMLVFAPPSGATRKGQGRGTGPRNLGVDSFTIRMVCSSKGRSRPRPEANLKAGRPRAAVLSRPASRGQAEPPRLVGSRWCVPASFGGGPSVGRLAIVCGNR